MTETIFLDDLTLLHGDALACLATLPAASIHCCITSPPYWGLRDYGHADQIGLEETPDAYVARLVAVFREVKRVLRDDGTLWLNLGDSYFGDSPVRKASSEAFSETWDATQTRSRGGTRRSAQSVEGLKPKDLVGIPWRVAFALQADGWWLRQDIIWAKPNPMPESVTDRCTKSHEYIFLLTKAARYFYDAEAIKEAANPLDHGGKSVPKGGFDSKYAGDVARKGDESFRFVSETRNKRDVWTVATQPYRGAHFATFPDALVVPMVLAGCPLGGTVLDPFAGSGTTAAVALARGRRAICCELNPAYLPLIRARCAGSRALPLNG